MVEAVKNRLRTKASAMPAKVTPCFCATFAYSSTAANARGRM